MRLIPIPTAREPTIPTKPKVRDPLEATSFQELVQIAELALPAEVLDASVAPFLGSLGEGAGRLALSELVASGDIKTLRQALRSSLLRAEVRWRGGATGERAFLVALRGWVSGVTPRKAAAPRGVQGARRR